MSAPDLHTYTSSRKIGDATVTVISEGSCLWAPRFGVPEEAWRRAMPDADADGRIHIAFNLIHIQLRGASVLVDPGFDDPSSSWDQAFGARWPAYTRTPGLGAALAALGVRAAEMTHVLITHAHDDHFVGITVEAGGRLEPRFPHARHLIGRQDWEGNPRRVDPLSELSIRLGLIHARGLLDLVDGEREVVPGVSMIHVPGETPGHSVVRVRSGEERLYFVGDLFHHACEIAHPDWVSPGRDPAVMRASRDRLLAEASSTATVVFAHAPFPAWGRIVAAERGYIWERQ
ncbi:MAG: MBL fold metallo-hydrolase [Armatimonadota bacterium]